MLRSMSHLWRCCSQILARIPKSGGPVRVLNVQVPDELYAEIQRNAEVRGRSLHDELVLRLGGTLVPRRPIEEELAEIDAFRASLGRSFDHGLVDQLIEEGRW